MEISIQVPDAVADRLRGSWQDLSRQALEALAVEAYRQGILTSAEVQDLLGIGSRYELDGFLKQAGAYLQYTVEDLEDDLRRFAEKTGR
jgi:predicted HTH domain antitoxin